MDSLQGRRVLVTGASSGIGMATARALAAAGAGVACLARRRERVEQLAEEIGGVAVAADVTDHTDARRGVEQAAERLGGLDGLVNNAGVARAGLIAETPYEDWRTMLDTNVLGLLSVTQAALGHLTDAGDADIVNISSMAGRRVPRAPQSSVYSATKHAVHVITQGLRAELEGTGVRVAVVSPGFVRTDIHRRPGEEPGPMHERLQELGVDPAQIADAVVRIVAAPPDVNMLEVAVLPRDQAL